MLDVDQNYGEPDTPKPLPTFKDYVAQDVETVFFNLNEFAEERYIDDKRMIDFSSTVVELSGDSEKQKEVQDIAKCLRTLYSTPIGSQEGDRELGINPNIFVDKPLPVAKGLYVAEVTEKTASFEPRARVVRVDWLDSDVLHGVVIPKVVYELV